MKLYTFAQLLETALMAGVLLYGATARRPSIAVTGGGLLIGKAILNILAPEGGSVLKRSAIGYLCGLVFVGVGVALIKSGV